MNPKRILIVAIVLGVIAVILLQIHSRRVQGGKVTVFKATSVRRAGESLKGAFEAVAVPATWQRSMKGSLPGTDLEGFVASTPLVRPVRPGDWITFDLFLKAADEGIRTRIRPGMRAIGIEVNGPQAVGYLVRPGDVVDVLGTIAVGENMRVKVLLQSKTVLAVGQQYRLEDSAYPRSRSYSTITLEVSPKEAQKIEGVRSLVTNGFTLALQANGDDTQMTPLPDLNVYSAEFDNIGRE